MHPPIRTPRRIPSELQFRQSLHNPASLKGYGYDTLDEVNDVARVIMLITPEVRVVDNATLFMSCDLIPLHDPLNNWFAVYHILIGFKRDTWI